MGLDVYLYIYDDLKTYLKLEQEYSEKSNRVWKEIENGREYEQLSHEEKDKAHELTQQLKNELNLDEYEGEEIEVQSSKYPEHLFKIGYFRSSYNGGGFDTVVGDAIGTNLYSIFEPNDRYIFVPDWNIAKERTEKMISEFKEYLNEGAFRAMRIPKYHMQVSSSKEAIGMFLSELKSHSEADSDIGKHITAYSSMKGDFFLNGFEIRAVINGINEVYLIYLDKEMTWYLEALEIVLETIEYVLAQSDKEKYALHWSS